MNKECLHYINASLVGSIQIPNQYYSLLLNTGSLSLLKISIKIDVGIFVQGIFIYLFDITTVFYKTTRRLKCGFNLT